MMDLAPMHNMRPIPIELVFERLPDAKPEILHCVLVSLNGGPEAQLGCSQGPSPVKVMLNAVPALPPACNWMRLSLTYGGAPSKGTATHPPDSWMRLQRTAPGQFIVAIEDGRDSNFQDLVFRVTGPANLAVENSGQPCQ